MGILNKITFLFKRPLVVFVLGKGCDCTAEAVSQVVKGRKVSGIKIPWVKSRKEIVVFNKEKINKKEAEIACFLMKNSRKPILVLTHLGNIPLERDSFQGEKNENIKEIVGAVKEKGGLVLNFDDETTQELGSLSRASVLSFGFQKRADLRATDINMDFEGINFKISYQNYIIPFWLEKIYGKEQIYAALAAAGTALLAGMNLVEASQSLKGYRSLPGKMRMIKGIKDSWIIDDSKEADPYSMREALSILSKIGKEKRKIAVLGDIISAGKEAPSIHESLGKEAVRSCDLLFVIGPRAKFIAKGAKEQGMPEDKVRHFYDVKEAKKEIQRELNQDDLILIDASKEMPMEEILEEIRFVEL